MSILSQLQESKNKLRTHTLFVFLLCLLLIQFQQTIQQSDGSGEEGPEKEEIDDDVPDVPIKDESKKFSANKGEILYNSHEKFKPKEVKGNDGKHRWALSSLARFFMGKVVPNGYYVPWILRYFSKRNRRLAINGEINFQCVDIDQGSYTASVDNKKARDFNCTSEETEETEEALQSKITEIQNSNLQMQSLGGVDGSEAGAPEGNLNDATQDSLIDSDKSYLWTINSIEDGGCSGTQNVIKFKGVPTKTNSSTCSVDGIEVKDVNITSPTLTSIPCKFNSENELQCSMDLSADQRTGEFFTAFTLGVGYHDTCAYTITSSSSDSKSINLSNCGTGTGNSGTMSTIKTSKKSSGLSGGAIAGISIACVVVAIAAVLGALLCGKSSSVAQPVYTAGSQEQMVIDQKPVYY